MEDERPLVLTCWHQLSSFGSDALRHDFEVSNLSPWSQFSYPGVFLLDQPVDGRIKLGSVDGLILVQLLGNVLNDLPLVALLSQCCQDVHNGLVPIQGVPVAVLAVAHDFLLLLGQDQLVVGECRLSFHQWLQVC